MLGSTFQSFLWGEFFGAMLSQMDIQSGLHNSASMFDSSCIIWPIFWLVIFSLGLLVLGHFGLIISFAFIASSFQLGLFSVSA